MSKTFRGITPLFQTELTRQIGKVTDAIDSGNFWVGYGSLKTLICMLNEKDGDEFLNNDIKHIVEEINEVMQRKKIDLYDMRHTQSHQTLNVLRRNLLLLFRKVMIKLHERGYLEAKPITPRRPTQGRMGVPK